MARIWQEGFEDGFPHGLYLEGNSSGLFIRNFIIEGSPQSSSLVSGRNIYSKYALYQGASSYRSTKYLNGDYNEIYFRFWINPRGTTTSTSPFFYIANSSGTTLFELNTYNVINLYLLKVYNGSSLDTIGSFSLQPVTWSKIDIHLKVGSTTGEYELKVNDVSIYSGSGLNIGTIGVNIFKFGTNWIGFYVDDIALNDTTGLINNSWCGNGTIVGLKPKGSGGKSEFTTSQGWVLGESGTTTTNIKITGHGLATGDVIYNVTRDIYRIVTKVDNDNLTVSSVTNQTVDDIFNAFTYQATITAAAGSSSALVNLPGHNLESYDVFVNVTRSNTIKRVIYVTGISLYNAYTSNTMYPGSTTSSQTSGDSIKTYKVKQYAIGEHYKTCNQVFPNPKYANIQSKISGQQDTFNMQELVADLAIPGNAGIIAISHGIYAKELGAGSAIKPVLRIGGVYYAGTAVPLTNGTLQYQTVYDTNPEDSAQWAISDVDSLEAGVEVV